MRAEKRIIQIILALILSSGSGFSAVWWINSSGDQSWTNPVNWVAGAVPVSTDLVWVNLDQTLAPIMTDGQVGVAFEAYLSNDKGDAYMTIAGGQLTVDKFELNKSNNSTHYGSHLDMFGGTLIARLMNVGMNNRATSMAMTNGLIDCNSLSLGNEADVTLSGGMIDVRWGLSIGSNARIDIAGGTLFLQDLSQAATVQSYIASGKIMAYGGSGTVNVDNNGSTLTLTAIPEAATVGLFMISGGGLFLLRRLFSI